MDGSIRLLSVLPSDLPAGIERLQSEGRDAKRQMKDLQMRLAMFEADALAARAEQIGNASAVIAALAGWDQQGLKTIASAIASRSGFLAVLFSVPAPSAIVIARAADLDIDSGAHLRKLTERFGGKGGGRADLAQGGGLQGSPEALTAFVRSML
jgi:alanyl-tRNA synthetase